MDEFVREEKNDQLRQLDVLKRSYIERLRETQSKEKEYLDLADALGSSDSKRGLLRQQIEMQQLSRLEGRIDVLQEKLLDIKSELRVKQELPAPLKREDGEVTQDSSIRALEIRMRVISETLEESQKEYERQKNVLLGSEATSADLAIRKDELTRLKKSVDETKSEIDRLELNVQMLDRVRVIQNADPVE
jgi:hypothetical protein